MIYEIELPYPYSVNHLYGYAAIGRNKLKKYITKPYSKYIELVTQAVNESGLPKLEKPLALKIYIYTPDKRKRDIDNVNKALFDSCTKAGLWIDDSNIVFSQSYKYCDPDKVGKIVLKIREVEAMTTKTGAWLKEK